MAHLNELVKMFAEKVVFDTTQSEHEKDSDKRCLFDALQDFLATGNKADAFTVYVCHSEIFHLFGRGYENTKVLLELLSDHEYHSGELLSKHRDHYSHSIYVFALGLAIYANDTVFRNAYLNFYGMPDTGESAFVFLRNWGLVSMYHDIGYPFQLAHEQIKTYTSELWQDSKTNPYVSFGNIKEFIDLSDEAVERIRAALPNAQKIENINELLAYGLFVRDGYDYKEMLSLLLKRVQMQPNFMDHAYFSAIILGKKLMAYPEVVINMQHLDVLTAILLHNNLNKHDIPNNKKLKAHLIEMDEHPLAYLLMLCDELQSWDRKAYGKKSKRSPIAFDVEISITSNTYSLHYIFDERDISNKFYNEKGQETIVMNPNYAEMLDPKGEGVFVEKILGTRVVRGEEEYLRRKKMREDKYLPENQKPKIYDGYIKTDIQLKVRAKTELKNRKSTLYMSDDNFMNLYDLAKAIHASYNEFCEVNMPSEIECAFGELPLEYKVSNIDQAKSWSKKFELLNCFYSSKDLDYPIINNIKEIENTGFANNMECLCREEHVRWAKEKLRKGWHYGRERDDEHRKHNCLVPYEDLSPKEQKKDELMIENMFELLRKFDGNIKVYNYSVVHDPVINVVGTGHRYIKGDEREINSIKKTIREKLERLSKNARVVVRTCMSYGADQLIMECAVELGFTIKAAIPMKIDDYVEDTRRDALAHGVLFGEKEENRMRDLLAQTAVCKVIPDEVYTYGEASQYIAQRCDYMIALWDGVETPLRDENNNPINVGGTYDTIKRAEKRGLKKENLFIIGCKR